jgi:membrane protein DedA with SNARE-associated domain
MLDAIGTTLYTVIVVSIGALVGERAVVFLTTDRRRWLFLLFALTAFATLIGYRVWRRYRHGAARAERLQPVRTPTPTPASTLTR